MNNYFYSRTPVPPPPPPAPPCPKPRPKSPPKNKLNFKSLKKDTCKSLNDVECFLNKFTDSLKYYKLINF
mgnify:FL=1